MITPPFNLRFTSERPKSLKAPHKALVARIEACIAIYFRNSPWHMTEQGVVRRSHLSDVPTVKVIIPMAEGNNLEELARLCSIYDIETGKEMNLVTGEWLAPLDRPVALRIYSGNEWGTMEITASEFPFFNRPDMCFPSEEIMARRSRLSRTIH